MPRYNILSLDGGGLRGLISALILDAVHQRLKPARARSAYPFYSYFDLIAGTSTGALIALCLASRAKKSAAPRNPSEIIELFRNEGADLFQASFLSRLSSIPLLGPLINALSGPTYSGPHLEAKLQQILGEESISRCETEVLISSYDMTTGQPWFFSRRLSAADRQAGYIPSDLEYPLWKVARASSAAPTYFPPFWLETKKGGAASAPHALIDGGLAANNPAMAALTEALSRGVKLENITLFSVGTGWVNTSERPPQKKIEWLLDGKSKPIVDAYANGNQRSTEFQLEQFEDGHFKVVRLDGPQLALKDSAMDDASLLGLWQRETELYCEDSKVKVEIRRIARLLA